MTGGFRSVFISRFVASAWGSCFGQLLACLLRFFWSFPSFFSSASLVTIKQSLPNSVGKNTIAISFAILNRQELSSVLFFRQKALWFENRKSLQCLENAQRDTRNIVVNKETLCYCLGNIYLAINLVIKYSGTIRTCSKFLKRTYCTRKCGQTTTCIQCLWKTIVAPLHLRMLCHENFISVISVVQHNQLSTSNRRAFCMRMRESAERQ